VCLNGLTIIEIVEKNKTRWILEFSDEEALVVKTLYNEKWVIGNDNTTNISKQFIYILDFKNSSGSECCMLSSG